MAKLEISELVIEVTRRCNMHCAHCLRGEDQNINMNLNHVTRFLDHVDSIGCITFTGGEPTMNVPGMIAVLDEIRRRDIPLYGFFIATNGKVVTDAFLHFMVDLYAYTRQYDDEPYHKTLALSQDQYHEPIDAINRRKLSALSCFDADAKKTDFTKRPPIRSGRAKALPITQENWIKTAWNNIDVEKNDMDEPSYNIDGAILISCMGDIIGNCDYEYENPDPFRIGTIFDMDRLIHNLDTHVKS